MAPLRRRLPIVGYAILMVGVMVTFAIFGNRLDDAIHIVDRQNRAIRQNQALIARLTKLEGEQSAANATAHHLSCDDQQDTWDVANKFIEFETSPGQERRELNLILGVRPVWDGKTCTRPNPDQ